MSMKVSELKMILANMPDDAEIFIKNPSNKNFHAIYGIAQDILHFKTKPMMQEVILYPVKESAGTI